MVDGGWLQVLHFAARLVHELCTRLHRAKRVDEQQAAISEVSETQSAPVAVTE